MNTGPILPNMAAVAVPAPPPPLPQFPSAVDFVAYNDTGRINIYGAMPEESFAYCLGTLKHNIVRGKGLPETHYIEFVGEARAPVLRVRPELTDGFDRTEIAVGEPVTLPSLPAAIVSFEGPLKGQHDHPGGDLMIGWTIPGTYTLTIDAFPYMSKTFSISVGASS